MFILLFNALCLMGVITLLIMLASLLYMMLSLIKESFEEVNLQQGVATALIFVAIMAFISIYTGDIT